MIRHLTATGLDTSTTTFLQPNVGYRWRILSILLWLTTGTATGNRAVNIGIAPYQSSGGLALIIANTQVQSGVSSTYYSQLIGASNAPGNGGGNYTMYSDIYSDASAHIAIDAGIQTGDTYGYDIQVIEEPDI